MKMLKVIYFLISAWIQIALCIFEIEDMIDKFESNRWIETGDAIKQHIGSHIEPTEFRHHNHEELMATLKSMHERFPTLTHLYSIGKSVQQRDLLVLAISTQPSTHKSNRLELKFIGNIHGNEVSGRELLLNLVELLLVNYGKNSYLTELLNTTRIHILPSMNPDGHSMAIVGDELGVLGRLNANGIDLNRNFPSRLRINTRKNHLLQSETKAVIRWTRTIPFVLSASYHDGSSLVNFPFDDYQSENGKLSTKTGDHELFAKLAYSYARAHEFMWKKGPRCMKYQLHGDPLLGITKGADWYRITGGMQDWNYMTTGCFELTVEMSCLKYPHAKELKRLWDQHKWSMIVLINQAHYAIHGTILDAVTGEGIENAEILINKQARVIRSTKNGDYWRLINPGNYTVIFRANSYSPFTEEVEITTETPSLVLNIALVKSQ